MAAPTNYLGAAVFWLYILFALLLTAIVLQTLHHLAAAHPILSSRQPLVRRFSILALISFSTLSFNMLHVLIQSFNLWNAHSFSQAPESLPVLIWRWSVSSTLFLDFGEAIVKREGSGWVWVLGALVATLSACFWMGYEGSRRGVPRLWAFFGLAQILPISYTVNLFYVALLLLPEEDKERNESLEETNSVRLPGAGAAAVLAYCAIVFAAPEAGETPWLMPLILVARLLLFAPLLLADRDDFAWHSSSRIYLIPATILMNDWLASGSPTGVFWELLAGILVHPAVSSLGCDWVLYMVSAAVWQHAQGALGKETTSSAKKGQ